MEESHWKQKANINWRIEGERNTKFFHASVKRKQARMSIHAISHDNVQQTTTDQLKQSAIDYFDNIFASSHTSAAVTDNPLLLVPNQVTDEMNALLCSPPSVEELKNVVFALKPDSAAGLDGFSALFLQTCWDFIQKDLFVAVIDYFSGALIPKAFAHTLIALIPKSHCLV